MKYIASGVICAALILASCSQPNSTSTARQPEDPQKTAEALKHFDQNKFGMFIHWGLYAIPAGEWKGKYVRGIGEWIMFREKIPVAEYSKLAGEFNPVKFSGAEWSQLAKDAGMKYLVITSKHHDGFAMFASKASKYNIVDATPYAKDPMKELSAACAERGLDFGFYYSQDQDWHEANGRGNNWDFPEKRDAQVYLEGKVLPQIREILTQYGKLSLIWFDTPGLLSDQQTVDLRAMVKSLQPSCLINSRIGHDRGDYAQTGDNAIPIQVYTKDGKWEVPATLNDTWGYKKNDQHWKDPRDLIGKLADIVSKGGNYLLNVGPTAEGVIPPASQDILRTIGKWLDVNGESIYGTNPSPMNIRDITWRVTTKPGKLYFHILNWPGARMRVDGLESDVKRAYWLAGGAAVPVKKAGNGIEFTLPAKAVDPYDSVLVAEIDGDAPKIAAGYGADEVPAKLDLYAWVGHLRGEEIRYDWATQSASGFKKFENASNALVYFPYKALDGDYDVEVTYSCANDAAGGKFQIVAGRRGANPDGRVEGTIEKTGNQFVTRKAGRLTVRPQTGQIIFDLLDDKSAAVKIRKITLSRASS